MDDLTEHLEGPHWPDGLALNAFAALADGRLDGPGLRRADRFLHHVALRNGDPSAPTAEDWRAWGSCSRIEKTCRVLEEIGPETTHAARPVLRELRRAKWRQAHPRRSGAAAGPARRVSLPETEWPRAWRRAVRRLRRGATARQRNIVSPDAGEVVSPKVLANLVNTVAELARVAADADLGEDISHALIDRWIARLDDRGVRDVTKAIRLKEIRVFAGELGADATVVEEVRRLATAFAQEANRHRTRKERRFLALDFGVGEVFERARACRLRAAEIPPWREEAVHARLDAALLGLSVNAPLRCGDLHRVRIGHELERTSEGWRFAIRQEKTGDSYEMRRLWPEVGEMLDAVVLGGRDETHLWTRLNVLEGRALFAWDDDHTEPVDEGWPTKVWRRHVGVGIHMVRSLWATHYADENPHESWAASDLLGHGSGRTREAYEVRVRRDRAVAQTQDLIEGLLKEI